MSKRNPIGQQPIIGQVSRAAFWPFSGGGAIEAMENRLRVFGMASVMFCLIALGDSAHAVVGANTPFTCYEVEAGALAGGALVRSLTAAPTNSASSPELEASGHAFVQLAASGQSVTLTNTTGQNITALNVRYSIPDATTGGGIAATLNLYVDGAFRQSISLNSTQTWCYQKSGSEHGWSQDPAYGSPHIFYDETHFFISGSAVAPGGKISFKKDADNTASFYWLEACGHGESTRAIDAADQLAFHHHLWSGSRRRYQRQHRRHPKLYQCRADAA